MEHIRLESKLQVAAMRQDRWEVKSLIPDVESAEKTRAYWREAIRNHDTKAPATGVALRSRGIGARYHCSDYLVKVTVYQLDICQHRGYAMERGRK